MTADSDFGKVLSILTLAVAVPAWAQAVIQPRNWKRLWLPVALVTASILTAVLLESWVAAGVLALDYSLRFAAIGIPLTVMAIVVTLQQRVGYIAPGILISAALSVVVWLFLITLH